MVCDDNEGVPETGNVGREVGKWGGVPYIYIYVYVCVSCLRITPERSLMNLS